MITQKLEQLGLSEKEAKVYASLFKLGPTPASVLARITGIRRTSIYDILHSLLEQNLISQIRKGNCNFYVIDDVNKLLVNERERVHTAKELVAELKQQIESDRRIQVSFYEGIEGYKEIYEQILKISPPELVGWINFDVFSKVLEPEYEEKWTERRINQGIKVRLLMQRTKLAEDFQSRDTKSNRETRLVDSVKFPFDTTSFIFGDYIAFFDATNGISGILVRNAELAKMHRSIFELSWINSSSP